MLTFICLMTLVILLLGIEPGGAAPERNLSQYTARQWAATFARAHALPFAQRVAFWADLAAVKSVYVLDPLGEGSGALPDPGPLCDFAHVDCVTYLEQVYALTLSATYTEFPAILRHIRYRESQVAYRWRNHYTVSDWLPANTWFLRDVTEDVGSGTTLRMTKTISRAKFFAEKGLPQYHDIPDEVAVTTYIPRERAVEILGKLHTGDLLIFVIDTPGIIAGHVGLARTDHGVVMVQHASMTQKAVVTVPLQTYLDHLPARFVGIKVARVYLERATQ